MISPTDLRPLHDAEAISQAVGRVADAIAQELQGRGPVFLAGIPTRGAVLAQRLENLLRARGVDCGCGTVDISMHRDDLGLRGGLVELKGTTLPVDLENWNVVLVDDVQQTGRTARAAIEAVLAFGRPKRILYAVLADRGGRELPVRPDFTGLVLSVPASARVRVRLAGADEGEEGIFA
ncbi:MAG: bifunctional pyr operon transcriptional regulator/uracil phosphoribosyltransferase PyrR [Chthoniobacterales bacterium]|nr:bifunctional pyr operon transcriptional regulator/uracil phosphoribosyltransferase PyrR [Chthoniobacterales bacterium]